MIPLKPPDWKLPLLRMRIDQPFELNGDKALGPGRITTVFRQENWDIVKMKIMNLFKDFYDSGRFVIFIKWEIYENYVLSF